MIRAAIICPDQDLADQLQQALSKFPSVSIARVLHQYPNAVKLPAFLNASAPDLVFLSAKNTSDAIDVATRINAEMTGTPIVAIHDLDHGPAMLDNVTCRREGLSNLTV